LTEGLDTLDRRCC